ncbi:hypothetical protein [Kitasatospora cheerisanensis]|uniref:Uncharacterized protein n=1 Tax=Kitasatospora cheerisanensis KCTC 2395 TaxID=1348663 RepID=A0A066YWH3_9ACTN|nr:hypothetical protein [Kitasatospora cheerisanensis]KDN85582.1 hypothetical protein KCH_25990 [Kitasatospora cheerisanensis KCTC 2395]
MPIAVPPSGLAALAARAETGTLRIEDRDPAYEPGAVVPAGQWSPLAPADARRLAATTGTPANVLTQLVALPPSFDLDQALATPTGTTLLPTVADGPVHYLGTVTSPPGQATTTLNHHTGQQLGVHLDNWDRLPYLRRHLSRRRLCVNLGPGPRHLILGRHDAQHITRTVHPDDYTARCPHTDDLRRYIASGGDPACIRLRLDPGDAYLAPTELLPHDGSTAGLNLPSTAAFWLGTFPADVFPDIG